MSTLKTPPGNEAVQFILNCQCGRFKARCRGTYMSWRQDMLDDLMMRVWQHVQAKPDWHEGVSWEDIEAFPVECWSDSWAQAYVVPLIQPGDVDEDYAEGHDVVEAGSRPSRRRSRTPPPRRGSNRSRYTRPSSIHQARELVEQAVAQVERTMKELTATRAALRGLLDEDIGSRR